MQLRGYQKRIVGDALANVAQGRKRIGVFAGCGAGKTIIAAKLAFAGLEQGKKVIFCVHLDVLVEQTAEKMAALGLDCGFIKAGLPENPAARVQIASIQTMQNRDWWRHWGADVVFFDEAHITLFSQIGQELLYSVWPNAIFFALTGTPRRLGSDQLGSHLDCFVSAPTPAELTQQGYLSPLKYYSIGQADLANVGTGSDGDYDVDQLKIACDRDDLTDQAVSEWHRLTKGLRTVSFCVDTEHAQKMAAAFAKYKVPAACVTGSTPKKKRSEMYEALGKGELLVLTSCNVISIGFDEPSVEVGMLCRPTQSSALHFQQLGRVARTSKRTGKTHGVILDQAGNLLRHGFPEDIWRYEMPYPDKKGAGSPPPKKQCPNCASVVNNFQMQCACGFRWLKHQIESLSALEQVFPKERINVAPEMSIQLFHGYRRYAMQEGLHPSWAIDRIQDYLGSMPKITRKWTMGSLFGPRPAIAQKLEVLRYLKSQSDDPEWVEVNFDLEYGSGALKNISKGRLSLESAKL